MGFDLARVDTICALATARAPAALAIVRISGPRAHDVIAGVFVARRPPQRPFVATLGDVRDGATTLDEALCTLFLDGRSYTGEPMAELSLHGGPLVVREVLALLLRHRCRLAEPGEFTQRAVLSGRMDLVAAEAVDDVIHARTATALHAAQRNLHGALHATLQPVRATLVDALAELEARLDFPDEDIGEARVHDIAASLTVAQATLGQLLSTSTRGDRLRRGARVLLYGAPNAGKSTLFNALLNEDRALVDAQPGTTRDVLEAAVEIDGVEVTVVDVAGVRDSAVAGAVELQGIARAQRELMRAEVVLVLAPADQSAPPPDIDAAVMLLHVTTKADVTPSAPGLAVSAHTGQGMPALRAAIAHALRGGGAGDGEATLLRARQVQSVQEMHDCVGHAIDALRAHAHGEVVASELRRAAAISDGLFGHDAGQEVLDAIFSRFCIGK